MENDFRRQKDEAVKYLDRNASNVEYKFKSESAKVVAASADQIENAIEGLKTSIAQSATSAEQLGEKVRRLNCILTWATVVLAIAAVAGIALELYKLFFRSGVLPR